jgi:hypothetical protein
MPRGRRKIEVKTLEEQIIEIDAEMESYQQKIQEAKAKRKELADKKKQKEIDALYAEIQASGKTIEDVISLIKQE